MSNKPSKKPPKSPGDEKLPARYHEWIEFVFDRPETPGGLLHWCFEKGFEDFEATDEELAKLAIATLRRCTIDLSRLSDLQISDGLDYMLGGPSDVGDRIVGGEAAFEDRQAVIHGTEHLYLNFLEHRAAPVLGHRSEKGNAINYITYMLWDVMEVPEDLTRAALSVLEQILLRSRNDACREGALHGLQHLRRRSGVRVADVIERFLQAQPELRPEVIRYARYAADETW